MVSAPFIMNFMLEVPESLPAMEICSRRPQQE